jgi:antitoxin Phd
MTEVQIQKAKAHFSEMLERAQAGETIVITKHGKPTVAMIDIEEYRALKKPKRSLLEVLRAAPENLMDVVPPRDKSERRSSLIVGDQQ